MSIQVHRPPTPPGEILLEEFLKPLNITPEVLSKQLECDLTLVNGILSGTLNISEDLANKLGQLFNTTPQFWLNAQGAVNKKKHAKRLIELYTRTLKVCATAYYHHNQSLLDDEEFDTALRLLTRLEEENPELVDPIKNTKTMYFHS